MVEIFLHFLLRRSGSGRHEVYYPSLKVTVKRRKNGAGGGSGGGGCMGGGGGEGVGIERGSDISLNV